MKVKTTRFGEVEVNEDLCFDMVSPILGYDNQKKFFIIEHKQQSNFRWLQSVDSPDLAFVITMPGLFGIDYSFELPEKIQHDLDINDADDILSFNIVVIPHENPQASTINLVAPLVFNIKNKKGAQVVLTGTNFKVDTLLFKKGAVC